MANLGTMNNYPRFAHHGASVLMVDFTDISFTTEPVKARLNQRQITD